MEFIVTTILGFCMLFLILSCINSGMNLFYDVKEENMGKVRLRQLKDLRNKESMEFKEMMDKLAEKSNSALMPRLKRLLPSLGKIDYVQLKKNLALATWDDTFTPESFIACVWALRVIGIACLPLLLITTGYIRIIIGLACVIGIFGLEWWLNSGISSIKEELLAEFPDFIRIVSGYLSADMTLESSIQNSIKYVGDAWAPILKTFIVQCETTSLEMALDKLKDDVDLFEVKEFVSLVRLTVEQGGEAKDSFLSQADKIEDMQRSQLVLKVGKRKMMGQVLQAPLLLLNMVIIALPTLMQAFDMFGGDGMTVG